MLDQSDHEQSTKIADLQLFRIMLRVQHGCHDVEPQHGPLLIWDEIFQAIKASSGKYPQTHIHCAAVHAYNFGVKAFYFGRKMEAEQWIGMAYKLTKNTSLCEKQTLEKISQVSLAVLFALLCFNSTSVKVLCLMRLYHDHHSLLVTWQAYDVVVGAQK